MRSGATGSVSKRSSCSGLASPSTDGSARSLGLVLHQGEQMSAVGVMPLADGERAVVASVDLDVPRRAVTTGQYLDRHGEVIDPDQLIRLKSPDWFIFDVHAAAYLSRESPDGPRPETLLRAAPGGEPRQKTRRRAKTVAASRSGLCFQDQPGTP